jgi:hypothetical protein
MAAEPVDAGIRSPANLIPTTDLLIELSRHDFFGSELAILPPRLPHWFQRLEPHRFLGQGQTKAYGGRDLVL